MPDDTRCILVRAHGMLIVFEATAEPRLAARKGVEVLSWHRNWGKADQARRQIQPPPRRRQVPPNTQQGAF